jgi:hypothetical protein
MVDFDIKTKGVGLRIAQRVAGATLLVAGFTIMIGLITNNFRYAKAEETTIAAQMADGSLFITLNNSGPCSGFDAANNRLDIDVISGGIASDCFTVAASTDSRAGYTLTIAGSDELKANDNLAIQPTTGTMENPTNFASQSVGGAWGFAIPKGQIHGLELGFDNSYQVLARNNTTNEARFAAVPATPTPFSITDAPNTTLDAYNVFFAVATGQNMPTGDYSGVVNISGFMNTVPVYDCNNPSTSFATGCTDHNISVVMSNGMIGVRYTGEPGAPEWTVSGPTDPLWYHYTNKEWANAVTFRTPANRNLPVGTVLNEEQLDDILGYWVYIPRFEYRLINTGFDGVSHCGSNNPQFCPQAFDVKFVRRDAPIQYGTQIGDWHTHPAFMIDMNGDGVIDGDNEQVAGLWMAKYEASLQRGDDTSCLLSWGGCSITLEPDGTRAATFVPFAVPWGNVDLLSIHQNAQNIPYMHGITYSSQDNFIVNGLTNASWGAAVYLSQSLYGVCTNRYCSWDGSQLLTADGPNMQKIYNNGYHIWDTVVSMHRLRTGCGPAGTVSAPLDTTHDSCSASAWYTEVGMLASSNHNPTGIFDLAGGIAENTFSARASDVDSDTFTNWRETGLDETNFNFNRFSDILYFYSDFAHCDFCIDDQPIKNGALAGSSYYLGLALAETVAESVDPFDMIGGWGGDQSVTPNNRWTVWFLRGGFAGDGGLAGAFNFSGSADGIAAFFGWRAVIAGS